MTHTAAICSNSCCITSHSAQPAISAVVLCDKRHCPGLKTSIKFTLRIPVSSSIRLAVQDIPCNFTLYNIATYSCRLISQADKSTVSSGNTICELVSMFYS